ncbi:peptidylprolyl isomerase [Leptobacterium sp. I13]|uniref:peptidylprolyl isomerase n=1 Tax=Leptobacterium meishanense TaxID=3128904 RepID=UPI0030EBABF6
MKMKNKIIAIISGLAITQLNYAQTEIVENIPGTTELTLKDTVNNFKKIKVDGVAAVVGDYLILESDIDKNLIDLQLNGVPTEDITRCQLLGKLMEDKLYAHHAIQDSIEVSDAEIKDVVSRQIDFLAEQIGSVEKVLAFYKKEDEQSFRQELFEIQKLRQLSERMQEKIIEDVEITPEEVRQWFNDIPKDQLPVFGTELEIAQIVIAPKAPQEEVQKAIDKLKEIKEDIEENGSSFATKAILYSDDEGSRSKGGFYTITKKTAFVQEFKDIAFSLQEGEVSEPFETEFGWHILTVDKIRGQELDVRHILIIPEIPEEALIEAKKELDTLRKRIIDGEMTFAEAAKNFSDEKETKFDGGVLRNPTNFDTRFELTKMDPTLYNQVRELKEGEISLPLLEEERAGVKKYKVLKVTDKFDEHIANYSQDYIKIKDLALKEKQLNTIKKWMTEKINDTYISVGTDNSGCDFANNWLKK